MAFPFKAVAFDMDGTFLRDDKTFDRKLFSQLLDRLLAQDVHVIVASGDQYECLLKYFPTRHEQLTFISENGAHVIDHDRELMVQTMDPTVVDELIPFIYGRENGSGAVAFRSSARLYLAKRFSIAVKAAAVLFSQSCFY